MMYFKMYYKNRSRSKNINKRTRSIRIMTPDPQVPRDLVLSNRNKIKNELSIYHKIFL